MSSRISDLATEVRDIYIPNKEDDLPYIGLEHVEQGSLRLSSIGSSQEVVSHKSRFKSGDILFGTLRPYFRKVIIAPCDGVCSTEFCVVRANNPEDQQFVFYGMAQPQFIEYATVNSNGARPRTKWKLFSDFELPQFLPSQRRDIGDILSTYDDLIENNRRRIQLLEQAARLLYKEWFVHFRFPGHEHVKITDGVPEGWNNKSLTDLADGVSYGFTASSTQEEVGPKFLRITDIVPAILDWEEVPFCEANEKEIDRNRLEVGDVVVARTGATVGYAKLITHLISEAVYASYLVRFRFRNPTNRLIAGIFMESDNYKEYVRNHAGGAAQPNANAKVLGSAILLIPPQVLLEQFNFSVTPVLNQRDALIRQNTRLVQARDLLLPRLMNGELAV